MARLLIVEDSPELALLMAAAARVRGHEAVSAQSGQEALERLAEGRYDVAVVDLMLQDMPGTQVIAALRERGTPALAMSGVLMGEALAREATEVHGARRFFEKPFEMAAVLEALEDAAGVPAAPLSEPASPMGSDDDLLLALEESDVAIVQDPEPAVTPEPEAAPEPGAGDELALPFARRGQVWQGAAEPSASPPPTRRRAAAPPDWALAGDLATTSVPRLLTAHHQARHTGELRLQQGQVLKHLYFSEGRPVYAASNLVQERFARFAVRRGVVAEDQLPQVVKLVQERGLKTGDAMLELGLLDVERRRWLLEEQVKEIIWSTFGWKAGRYGFSARPLARKDLVALSVHPGNLILEGVVRTEPLLALRQAMPPTRRLFPVSEPPYALHELKLSGAQALLLAYADGTKTVEDLRALSELDERNALGTLRGFELLGLVEERREAPRRERITFGL